MSYGICVILPKNHRASNNTAIWCSNNSSTQWSDNADNIIGRPRRNETGLGLILNFWMRLDVAGWPVRPLGYGAPIVTSLHTCMHTHYIPVPIHKHPFTACMCTMIAYTPDTLTHKYAHLQNTGMHTYIHLLHTCTLLPKILCTHTHTTYRHKHIRAPYLCGKRSLGEQRHCVWRQHEEGGTEQGQCSQYGTVCTVYTW